MKISNRFINSYTNGHNPGERRFVCDVIRRFVHSDRSPIHIPENLDWGCIDLFLRQDNLKPLFYLVLKNEKVDPKRLSDWQKVRMAYFRRNLLVSKTAAAFFHQLERHTIAAAALRGLRLANFVYPDFTVRSMRDVDILVQASRDQVRAALRSLAGEPHRVLRTQDVFIVDQTAFEIHYSYLTTKRYRLALDTEAFLKTAGRRRTSEGAELICLSAENELIGVVAHAFIHHGLDRMMPLVDMALLMSAPTMDWDFIVDWCKKTNLCNMFHFTLACVNYLFGLQQENLLNQFESQLPSWAVAAFEAYACRIWGWDHIEADRLRRRIQRYAAETFDVKWRQILHFFSYDELRAFARLMVKKEVHQKTGMETVHDFESANEHRDESRI